MKPTRFEDTLIIDRFTDGAGHVQDLVATPRIEPYGYRGEEAVWGAEIKIEVRGHLSAEDARHRLIDNLRHAADLLEQAAKRGGKLPG